MNFTALRKFLIPETIFGIGAVDLVGQYAEKFGTKKPLVVTDAGVVEAGWTTRVMESLAAFDIHGVLFSEVTPNPKTAEVMAGVAVYTAHECDGIVAVGGGSPMDCAKGIGIVVSNGGHILDYEGVDKIIIPMPPLICIPTTAGTSADMSQFAIINNTERKTKITIISKTIVPDVALIDPQTLMTKSQYLIACTGMDALAHAIEAFVSSAHSVMTDVHALEAIRLVHGNLLDSFKHREDMELKAKIMLGSMQAGMAFSNASLGAAHAMAHSLGGYNGLPHGECNALLLPHVVDYNFSAEPERFRIIAETMGLDPRGMSASEIRSWLIKSLTDLRSALGIKETLSSKGIRSSDIPELSDKAVLDPCLVTNPKAANKRDIQIIYEEAT
ncbi:iron-containing alcohol dehydrogenase [Desulfomicrobium sp. ZS1]|uniref:alcohol dehydrogenase-like regulatory protein ErcA n=1 Tax=Desulfomicrobium sp. ZS1 TaxID=2952228 RepID=UPI0020B411A6|nr:alcohol dehydrogenase-like regulatory protein ErcA [Desulfomicrobium sp. ZS1]UTF51842.1 iron-containing alcohol dehydrogenase [Desulfomicrobium sp. ZS1]